MGDIIVSPSLRALFEKLRRNELPETIGVWERKLAEMEPFLKIAEHQQFERKDVKMWFNDLQDWSYDAEEILDDFATNLRLKDLHQQQDDDDDSSSTSSYFSCHEDLLSDAEDILNESYQQDDSPASSSCFSVSGVLSNNGPFLSKIESINKRLENIQNRSSSFSHLPESLSREKPHIRRGPETSSIPSKPVLGRDDDKRKIINLLLTDELNHGNFIVIPIVGQGGIGKTTLAQSVYNDDLYVKPHFETKAWVCVSEVFDVLQITTAIINAISGHKPSKFSDLNKAQEKLQEILGIFPRKNFLIVLDDVWSESYELWDQLQAPFKEGYKGSRVIVTTRLESVAKNMMTTLASQSHFVYLKVLSDDECWRICKQHAGINDDPIDEICKQHAGINDDPIDEMRDQVTELSKGLPLAAKALGGLLKKSVRSEWSTILRNEPWSETTDVLPALRLSYYHLPPHLKRVFAYCSVFPKDHKMVEEDVVLMWMAEGFVPESKNESMEHKAHSYFADLVSRSLFEPSPRSGKGYFIMHDLIHDLAQWVSGDVCCRLQRNEDDDAKDRCRFLSVTKEIDLAQLMDDKAGKKLRTFAILPMPYYYIKQAYTLDFQKLRCIRVLCMGGMGFEVLPSSIGNLKHLRLLDLSGNNLKELPESMSTLCNLQTLILKRNRHLTKVLNMRPFVELRHLDIEGCSLEEMPSGFKELRNMRTSRTFIIAENSGPRISDLENLKYLSGSLTIFGLNNVMNSEDAQKAKMNEKLDLKILRIFWLTSNTLVNPYYPLLWTRNIVRLKEEELTVQREVLNQLKPPESIEEVELNHYKGIAFPDWLGSSYYNNMVVIKLNYCSSLEETPSFCPSLKILHIINCPKLKINLPSWRLEELVLEQCRELNSIKPAVIRCSRSVRLNGISSFIRVEGFWVPYIVTLLVTKRDISDFEVGFFGLRLHDNASNYPHIMVSNCPEVSSWRPENLYEELTELTNVTFGNCEAWTTFLESKFPSSLRSLRIDQDNTIKDISKFTQQSTCRLQWLGLVHSSLNTISNVPSTLQTLKIAYTKIKEPTKEWKLDRLTCLTTLHISDSSTDEVESIPDPDLPLPPSLVYLKIWYFKNLKSISLSSLPYLDELEILTCPKMKREGIHVPQGFVFKSRGGRCSVNLNGSGFNLQ